MLELEALLSAFVEEASEHADPDFDPSDVNAIGIAIITPDNSTLEYEAKNHGATYIDDCSITWEQEWDHVELGQRNSPLCFEMMYLTVSTDFEPNPSATAGATMDRAVKLAHHS